jgi:YaiO family outer membrane protein
MYKKARILHSSGKYEEAVSTLEKLIRINPSHSEAYKKLVEFRPDVLKNNIRATYTLDLFDPDFSRRPWQIASLAYGRKTKLGTVIARLNLAERFGESGLQGEVDAYPRINENNYCYLNYGYSSSGVFPRNRAGLEWYHNFPKAFEGSVGMRLLDFRGSTVGIYTFTVGKYAGNYWISLRSFFTPGSDGTSVSGLIQVRRYFADPENYFGLRLGYGVSPDDNRNLLDSNRQLTLKTRSVRLEYNHIFNHVWILNAGAVWGAEERIPKTFSGYYTIDISVSRLF